MTDPIANIINEPPITLSLPVVIPQQVTPLQYTGTQQSALANLLAWMKAHPGVTVIGGVSVALLIFILLAKD